MSFNMGAGGVKNVIDDNSCSSLYLLPDSVKELVSNRKYMIYDYGHHGSRWCLIYEEGGSFIFKIGSTRNERPNLVSQIDTDSLMDSYRTLICWGLDTLPYITMDMDRQYFKQWATFYRSLSVFNQQSSCIFNSNNAIGFEDCDNTPINEKFSRLCYLMFWLSAPEIRHSLPEFDDYIK